MILFVGGEERGYFIREIAAMKGLEIDYVDRTPSIRMQLNEILRYTPRYVVFDVEQYTDSCQAVAAEIERIRRAKNCEVIIFAPGYDKESSIIRELRKQEVKGYIFNPTQAGAKEEIERCLNGECVEVFTGFEKESLEMTGKEVGKKIGVTGVCRRIGTTTVAIQLVKYLQFKGYKVCYIEVNETGFVEEHGKYFVSEHDTYLGRVSYENVDMYYKQAFLQEIFQKNYDYYVFDYGAYSERGFNKTSFLEKDIRIFVAGSKASEMSYTQSVLKNEYYTDVLYMFNFISEKEKKDLLEYMEDKAGVTYFSKYAPDQFEFVGNEEFDRLLPIEDMKGKVEEKKGLFGRRKRKDHGKI